MIILIMKEKHITWLLALILICPATGASGSIGFFSILTLARANSPNIDLAYKFAAINPHSPDNAYKNKEH